MAVKKKVKLKVLHKEKQKLINLKVSEETLARIVKRAQKYADGNVSMWLRYAGVNHVPHQKDLV